MPRLASILAPAAAFACAAVLALPASVGAHFLKPGASAPSSAGAGASSEPGGLSARLPRATQRADVASYPVAGYSVKGLSTYFSPPQVQEVLNSLAGLVHGREMNALSVYVATPEEIAYFCGGAMISCYSPGLERIIISGVDVPVAGIPRSYTMAHEYGHHIANHSYNGPWSALSAGTKRWSTQEHVCEGIHARVLHPGDEGAHYWENPGEAFAESYATLNYPDLGLAWYYTPLLAPDPVSLERIRTDVTRPWTGRRTKTWRRMFGRSRGRVARKVATPLDGRLTVTLKSPKGTDFDLYLRSAGDGPGRVLKRDSARHSRKRVDANLCGEQGVRVEVRRHRGTGPFTVKIARP
jgi:hypothetical protein